MTKRKTKVTRTRPTLEPVRDVGAALDAGMPVAYRAREVAVLLSITPTTVRRLITRGLIRPMRALRTVLISDAEVRRFMRESEEQL